MCLRTECWTRSGEEMEMYIYIAVNTILIITISRIRPRTRLDLESLFRLLTVMAKNSDDG